MASNTHCYDPSQGLLQPGVNPSCPDIESTGGKYKVTMQSSPANHHSIDPAEPFFKAGFLDASDVASAEQSQNTLEPVQFYGHYAGQMPMNADAGTVARYLDVHQEWFCRCAQPMKVEPIGLSGYALVIGRFGSFGYEVEPKVGLHLLPQDQGVYRIQTLPVPGYASHGYDVDFQAALELVEQPVEAEGAVMAITQVEWELDLKVLIHFPRFIHALPKSLIQTSGDRILNQIVRQVSRRLTYKVQEDFHSTMGLPMPQSTRKRRSWG